MQTYSDIIESFPQQMQLPMLKLMDRLREETLDTVKRSDFEELKGVLTALGERISDLALAHKNSEKRLTRVEVTLQELAEAQRNSEKRLTRVEVTLQELAEAQNRTEQRVEELAEAQNRTEQRVEELAEAQRNTEKTLRTVVKEQKKIRKDFGGLSDSIGYGLEDRAIKGLPALLSRDLGLKIETLDRRFIEYPDGGDDEINIYGEGLIGEEMVYIIGESKSQLGKRDVDRFTKFLARVSNHLGARLIPLLVTYSVRPEVEQYAREQIKELSLYMSFEI
jgi:hypothetical protein